MFRKYNFSKYRAAKLRSQVLAQSVKAQLLNQIEQLYDEAVTTKNRIIQANLRLVVSIMKRRAADDGELFDLISDGNVSLILAVEKFDYSRGFRFSTYATWAITNNLTRGYVSDARRLQRFKTGCEPAILSTVDTHANPRLEESDQRQREAQVEKLLKVLDERERRIISSRFGLQRAKEPKTLEAVGAELGISKERVRQISVCAIQKLRQAAGSEVAELLD